MRKFSGLMFKPTFRFRSQVLINHQLQWPIVQRTAFYTFACALYFMVVLFYSESARTNHDSGSQTLIQFLDVLVCWAPGLMLMAPIIIYDILVFTNRIAGPMHRIRHEMQQLIDGQSDQPIVLRDDDWTEMALLFNQIQAEMNKLREPIPKRAGSLFSEPQEGQLDGLAVDVPETENQSSALSPEASEESLAEESLAEELRIKELRAKELLAEEEMLAAFE